MQHIGDIHEILLYNSTDLTCVLTRWHSRGSSNPSHPYYSGPTSSHPYYLGQSDPLNISPPQHAHSNMLGAKVFATNKTGTTAHPDFHAWNGSHKRQEVCLPSSITHRGRETAHSVPTSMQHSKVKNTTLDIMLSHYRNVRPLPLTSTWYSHDVYSLHFARQQSSTSKNNVCNVSTPCYQGMSHSYVEYCYQIRLNCLLSYILPRMKFILLPKIAIQIAVASFTYPINIFGVEISSHVTEASHHINTPPHSCLMQGCPLMRESKH